MNILRRIEGKLNRDASTIRMAHDMRLLYFQRIHEPSTIRRLFRNAERPCVVGATTEATSRVGNRTVLLGENVFPLQDREIVGQNSPVDEDNWLSRPRFGILDFNTIEVRLLFQADSPPTTKSADHGCLTIAGSLTLAARPRAGPPLGTDSNHEPKCRRCRGPLRGELTWL